MFAERLILTTTSCNLIDIQKIRNWTTDSLPQPVPYIWGTTTETARPPATDSEVVPQAFFGMT